ncbi:hypothetical protein D3C76_1514930 [compost metagenome]
MIQAELRTQGRHRFRGRLLAKLLLDRIAGKQAGEEVDHQRDDKQRKHAYRQPTNHKARNGAVHN